MTLPDHADEHEVIDAATVVAPLHFRGDLLASAKSGDAWLTTFALVQGADPTVQDEEGMTALHHAASRGARRCIVALVASGKCDYLLRDNEGRYASDLASEWARDRAVARLLRKKQRQQAEERGVPAWTPRPAQEI